MTDSNDPNNGWREHRGLPLWWHEDERFTQPLVWPYQAPDRDDESTPTLNGDAHE